MWLENATVTYTWIWELEFHKTYYSELGFGLVKKYFIQHVCIQNH